MNNWLTSLIYPFINYAALPGNSSLMKVSFQNKDGIYCKKNFPAGNQNKEMKVLYTKRK